MHLELVIISLLYCSSTNAGARRATNARHAQRWRGERLPLWQLKYPALATGQQPRPRQTIDGRRIAPLNPNVRPLTLTEIQAPTKQVVWPILSQNKPFVPIGSGATWPALPVVPLAPPPSTEVTSGPAVSETNYCDTRVYTTEKLREEGLVKQSYFIARIDCSAKFYQCANNKAFLASCKGDQVFDGNVCNHRYNVPTCPEYNPVVECAVRDSCAADEFACCADQKCISFVAKCDGVPDCADGEDEINCQSCPSDEFACQKSGRCIPFAQRCNGVVDDCGDGSNLDELDCGGCAGLFPCTRSADPLGGKSVCVDWKQRCDSRRDCPHGEDERNCKRVSKFLLCENQMQSVSKTHWCDGQDDCIDGSDEKYCF